MAAEHEPTDTGSLSSGTAAAASIGITAASIGVTEMCIGGSITSTGDGDGATSIGGAVTIAGDTTTSTEDTATVSEVARNSTTSIGGGGNSCRAHSASHLSPRGDFSISSGASETLSTSQDAIGAGGCGGAGGTLQRKIRHSVISKRVRPRLSDVKFTPNTVEDERERERGISPSSPRHAQRISPSSPRHAQRISPSSSRHAQRQEEEEGSVTESAAESPSVDSCREKLGGASSTLMLQAFLPRSGVQEKKARKMRSVRELDAVRRAIQSFITESFNETLLATYTVSLPQQQQHHTDCASERTGTQTSTSLTHGSTTSGSLTTAGESEAHTDKYTTGSSPPAAGKGDGDEAGDDDARTMPHCYDSHFLCFTSQNMMVFELEAGGSSSLKLDVCESLLDLHLIGSGAEIPKGVDLAMEFVHFEPRTKKGRRPRFWNRIKIGDVCAKDPGVRHSVFQSKFRTIIAESFHQRFQIQLIFENLRRDRCQAVFEVGLCPEPEVYQFHAFVLKLARRSTLTPRVFMISSNYIMNIEFLEDATCDDEDSSMSNGVPRDSRRVAFEKWRVGLSSIESLDLRGLPVSLDGGEKNSTVRRELKSRVGWLKISRASGVIGALVTSHNRNSKAHASVSEQDGRSSSIETAASTNSTCSDDRSTVSSQTPKPSKASSSRRNFPSLARFVPTLSRRGNRSSVRDQQLASASCTSNASTDESGVRVHKGRDPAVLKTQVLGVTLKAPNKLKKFTNKHGITRLCKWYIFRSALERSRAVRWSQFLTSQSSEGRHQLEVRV